MRRHVGISGTDFLVDHVKPAATELNAFILPGNVLSVAAGRVSFVLGFAAVPRRRHRVFFLHRLHPRRDGGHRVRDVDAAASCGVGAIMSVLVSGLFNAAGMLAPDGRCKTLDAAANGYVRGRRGAC